MNTLSHMHPTSFHPAARYHTGSASKPKSVCTLSSATSGPTEADGAVSGVLDAPPSPPPPSPPAMCPAELAHNSMVAMPYAQQYLGSEGVNMSNFFVATPICCHSRSTLLSGRWNHNNRGPAGYTGCMNMNVSRTDNPQWWEDTFVSRLRRDHGYAVGMFGKVLNVMDSYGCSPGFRTPNVDRFLIMCNHNFFNETWADDRDAATPGPAFNNTAINKTGYAPQDYTTTGADAAFFDPTHVNLLHSFVRQHRQHYHTGCDDSNANADFHFSLAGRFFGEDSRWGVLQFAR